jgi:hypothetical protein
MLESLGRIQNPLLRSLTAAATTCSIITFITATAVGISNTKDNAAYRNSLYAALLAGGCGAVFGLVYGDRKTKEQSDQILDVSPSVNAQLPEWKDWRNFVVMRKVKESEEITSFYLQPEDGGKLPDFQPGQFLTIKLDIPGQSRPTIRTYSLSDYAEPLTYYRLSIKREPAPQDLAVPPGLASNFMHDQVQEGSIIPAKPPSGKFVLDLQKSLPVVLISNGVGITPMISMAKACGRSNSDRSIWFLHGARDGRFHAFRDEVLAIAQDNPHLKVHFAYSRPRMEDEGQYHSTGYVDTALVQTLLGQQAAEYFLCGSPAFMQSLREGLKQAGVPESHVFFESFSKASKTTPVPQSVVELTNGKGDGKQITFSQSGKTLTWSAEYDNILEFAEANDINPPYSCRAGICGTCMCKIREGEVEYQETPTATIDEGSVLICISKPKTATVVLDV